MQCKAALKRLGEVESQLEKVSAELHQQTLVVQHKDAELTAAKQSVRGAVAKAMLGVATGLNCRLSFVFACLCSLMPMSLDLLGPTVRATSYT